MSLSPRPAVRCFASHSKRIAYLELGASAVVLRQIDRVIKIDLDVGVLDSYGLRILDEDLAELRAMAKELFAPASAPDFIVDAERLRGDLGDPTGILVRAKFPDGYFRAADVAFLDRDSFFAWMCAGGDNTRAQVVASIVLGHHKPDEATP